MSKHCRTGANLTIKMREQKIPAVSPTYFYIVDWGISLVVSSGGKGRSEGYCACEW